jgi:3-dehydroquinate dehydratase-2
VARYLVLQGPNLNLLGQREPAVYGGQDLATLEAALAGWARVQGIELEFRQSNQEGELIDALQAAAARCAGIVFNPGGFTHSSVALRDCIAALPVPVVEVHLTNLHAREPWRQRSLTGGAARGVISGFGAAGYRLALLHLTAAPAE